MPRKAFSRHEQQTVASGSAASTTPDISVGQGGTVYQVTVIFVGANQGPARVQVSYWVAGKRIPGVVYASKWVRAGSVVTDSDGLFWNGFLPVREDGEFQATVRNDSGASIIFRLSVVGID